MPSKKEKKDAYEDNVVQKVMNKLKDVATDFSTLDVVTLTGTIDISSAIDKDGKFQIKQMNKILGDSLKKLDGSLNVVAFTHLDLDSDAVAFVKDQITDEDKERILVHNEMVKTAQAARRGVINMLKELLLN